MHPVICTIGPFTVYSYGLMLVLAFVVVVTLAKKEALRRNIDPAMVFDFCFVVLLSGVIGARIFYVLENIKDYIKHPLEIILLHHGGLSWFGGLFLASLCGIIYLRIKKQSVYEMLDLIVPFLALGQAIGRIGCLLNGCCCGKISECGIYFPAHQEILIPAQIYSSLALVAIFFILRLLQNRPHWKGQIFFAYLLLYSAKRFFIEFWRSDNPVIFAGLTLFQIISIIIFLFALLKVITNARIYSRG